MSGRKQSGLAVTSTVNLSGVALTCPCHICALYHGAEDQYAALLPYLKEGLEAGDRVVSFVDADEREERRNRLRRSGVDVETAERHGQLDVVTWDQVYLRDGRFDADDMIGLVQETINTGRQLGFKRTRGWANMEWALQDVPGVEQLAIYESRLNYVLPLYSEAVVCAYDVTRFSASVLEDVARAHPHLCADGWVQDNPHYVPPEALVPEFQSRLS
jgi:hypothetical protein